MRAYSLYLLLTVVCSGCDSQEPVQPNPLPNDTRLDTDQPSNDSSLSFAHLVASETEYYTSGPQQGRSPDGTFPAGTRVHIIETAGSYLLVKSENGVEAYIAADAVTAEQSNGGDVSAVVEGINHFALDVYQQLAAQDGNLFFSPASISSAMAMTYSGAAGNTAAEMANTMHFPLPQKQLHDGMQAIQSSWTATNSKQGVQLNLANRLWGQQSYDFLPGFLAITRSQYGAELARLDFADSEQARQTINGWIEEQTNNKITDLIPPESISSDTRLVVTNAVYFHGKWTDPFPADRTEEADFYLAADDTIQVPLMHRRAAYRYADVGQLQMLELPYGDGSYSMVVLLPKQIEGLKDLESQLTLANLQQWMSNLQRVDPVIVFLPRFKTASQFQMSSTLQAMGMRSAFDPDTADFSRMAGNRELFISAVIHKAFVDVNEQGTEAAAATGVVVGVTSAPAEPREPPTFRADHPFVFLIRDNRNGAMLFLGRIVNPLE